MQATQRKKLLILYFDKFLDFLRISGRIIRLPCGFRFCEHLTNTLA